MAGTKIGGMKAAKTNKAVHGAEFYKMIGARGGKADHATPRGFAARPDIASIAGKKGGRISRRRKDVVIITETTNRKWYDSIKQFFAHI